MIEITVPCRLFMSPAVGQGSQPDHAALPGRHRLTAVSRKEPAAFVLERWKDRSSSMFPDRQRERSSSSVRARLSTATPGQPCPVPRISRLMGAPFHREPRPGPRLSPCAARGRLSPVGAAFPGPYDPGLPSRLDCDPAEGAATATRGPAALGLQVLPGRSRGRRRDPRSGKRSGPGHGGRTHRRRLLPLPEQDRDRRCSRGPKGLHEEAPVRRKRARSACACPGSGPDHAALRGRDRVMADAKKNRAASVLARPLAHARETGDDDQPWSRAA